MKKGGVILEFPWFIVCWINLLPDDITIDGMFEELGIPTFPNDEFEAWQIRILDRNIIAMLTINWGRW